MQATIYDAKYAEAKAYVAAGNPAKPSASDYPFLVAEAGARGQTPSVLAALIVATGDKWQRFAGELEAARVKVSSAVNAAPTLEDKRAAANAVLADVRALAAALAS